MESIMNILSNLSFFQVVALIGFVVVFFIAINVFSNLITTEEIEIED